MSTSVHTAPARNGYPATRCGAPGHLGYDGQYHERGTGWQLLGNGYRAYSATLMRFNSPDSLSPFGEGGINSYAYVGGDPVNKADPTWHFPASIGIFLGLGGLITGGFAAAVGVSGNEKVAAILGTVSGLLAGAALVAGGVYATRPKPWPMGAFRVREGRVGHVVDLHGREGLARVGQQRLDGEGLGTLLASKGAGNGKPVVLLSCRSAQGPRPLAQGVSDILGVPVKGYVGDVQVALRTNVPFLDQHAKWFYPHDRLNRATADIRNPRTIRGVTGRSAMQRILQGDAGKR